MVKLSGDVAARAPLGLRWEGGASHRRRAPRCSQLSQELPWPAWGQDSAPRRQDRRFYQTAQLAQRWPPRAAKSGPWAPAAGRGKRRQDVLSMADKSFPMNPC